MFTINDYKKSPPLRTLSVYPRRLYICYVCLPVCLFAALTYYRACVHESLVFNMRSLTFRRQPVFPVRVIFHILILLSVAVDLSGCGSIVSEEVRRSHCQHKRSGIKGMDDRIYVD
jgi:hypothetical protein